MRPAKTLKERIKHSLHLERALRLVWQSAPGWTVANFGLILIQGLLPLVSLYLMKLIVDAVTAGLLAPEKTDSLKKVTLLILLAAAVALFAACCRSLAEIVKEAQTQVVTDHVADVIHGKSVAVDLEYYEDPKYYDTLHRAQQEATYRPHQDHGQPDATGPKRHLAFSPGRFAVRISLVGCRHAVCGYGPRGFDALEIRQADVRLAEPAHPG